MDNDLAFIMVNFLKIMGFLQINRQILPRFPPEISSETRLSGPGASWFQPRISSKQILEFLIIFSKGRFALAVILTNVWFRGGKLAEIIRMFWPKISISRNFGIFSAKIDFFGPEKVKKLKIWQIFFRISSNMAWKFLKYFWMIRFETRIYLEKPRNLTR